MIKMLKNKLKEQKGLTLIELLAVIVILGIIAAIAIPSIGGIISKSKKDAQVAEAISIINAAKLAHSSNSDQTTWTHTATPAVKGTIYLKDYVENVEDKNYSVTYSGGVYSISNHDAAAAMGETADSAVTETNLINYTK